MNLKYPVLLLALALPCVAKEATAGGRVSLDYDDSRWQRRPVSVPGADVVGLAGDEGTFTLLVIPEKAIEGGMSSVESRRKYFEQLAKRAVKTEDIKSVPVAGKTGFEFIGKRDVGGVEYQMRIVLIVDAGDVVILMASAPGKDPMSVPTVASVWKTIRFSARGTQ